MKVFVFTGPEATGKSTLSKELAIDNDFFWVSEYARTYIEQLNRPYVFEDVVHIAQKQIEKYHFYKTLEVPSDEVVVFDTFLIITKIWFKEKFGKVPEFLEKAILDCKVDLFFLCQPDLPWIDDGVRENGHRREYLYQLYKNELINYNFPFVEISGVGDERLKNCELALKNINQAENVENNTF